MRASDLPRLGVIENPLDGDLFAKWSDLSGLDILCLGMSESQIDTFLAPSGPNSVHSLTLWSDHIDAEGAKYPLVIGDITQRTDFPDGRFDAVITMSVLEHVSDLGAALAEMARITKAGGQLLHIFGPVWSGPYGHHLCTGYEHPETNFYRWQMPAHMHLLCNEREVADYYEEIGLGRDWGISVHSQFHLNDHINRIFYDEYAALFATYQV
ncbi:MAG: methyltransferase domain-containing protein, partial [Sphingomonas sp.]|nr:methyltransferase domain-containing protein [Sphingomonas sp.]